MALLALVGPEGTVNFKKLLDAGWWFTSIIRWLAIAGIILYLPKFAAKRAERYARELEGWIDAYDNAEAQGATFETLQDIQRAPMTATKCASPTKNCCSTTASPVACSSASRSSLCSFRI